MISVLWFYLAVTILCLLLTVALVADTKKKNGSVVLGDLLLMLGSSVIPFLNCCFLLAGSWVFVGEFFKSRWLRDLMNKKVL